MFMEIILYLDLVRGITHVKLKHMYSQIPFSYITSIATVSRNMVMKISRYLDVGRDIMTMLAFKRCTTIGTMHSELLM